MAKQRRIRVWKPIPGFKHYEASSDGKIRSLPRYVQANKGGKRMLPCTILRPTIRNGYAEVCLRVGDKRKNFGVHRLVYQAFNGRISSKTKIDHEDRNKRNNNRRNLRTANKFQNAHNRVRVKPSSSGFIGVAWLPKRGKFKARIGHKGKLQHLGYFDRAEDAAAAYDAAVRTQRKSYGVTNQELHYA